jgi:pyruvate/2-oxoacid:ferredoxin oxidoreductase alpha subunit
VIKSEVVQMSRTNTYSSKQGLSLACPILYLHTNHLGSVYLLTNDTGVAASLRRS